MSVASNTVLGDLIPSGNYGSSGFDWGSVVSGAASLAAGVIDTGVNYKLTKDTNKQNEALMRESWSREDNAVQRRVADLKAAGLSPTLAAGQAAASSGPVTMKAPQINTSGALQNAFQVASAVKQLKNMDLQNDILRLQKDYYGYPDWAVAGIRMFGLEGFKDIVRGLGGKLFGDLFGDVSTGTGSGSSGSGTGSGSSGSGTGSGSSVPVKPEYNEPVVTMALGSKKPVSEILSSTATTGTTAWMRDNMLKDKGHITSDIYRFFTKSGNFTEYGEKYLQKFANRYNMTYDDAARLIYDWAFDYLE